MAEPAASQAVNVPLARRVLVVDDEPSLREAVRYNLLRAGYIVEEAADGSEALARARATQPDLVILDVMLPGVDGLKVCRTLRQESDVPILLLSARGEEVDRVLGLELGADDYLTKPFAMRELLARVNANLRRVQMSAPRESGADGHTGSDAFKSNHSSALVITMGSLRVDTSRREAEVGDRQLNLKRKEFDLLVYLMRHPGIVLSRNALLREVWGYDVPVDTRTIDVHVSGLRQKLEAMGSGERRIETVRGYGYRFISGSG
jgi:DNA-binding response OmpR family regulator